MGNIPLKDLRNILKSMGEGRRQTEIGRFAELYSRIRLRDAHFYNTSQAAPKFAPPYDQMETFQSDIPRQIHNKLRARIKESPLRVRVTPPKDTVAQRKAASDLEMVLETGLELAQEEYGIDIQGDLMDGQVIHCYGVLHWQKATDILPDFPEPDFSDESRDGFNGSADEQDEDDSRGKPRRRKGKFRETDESMQERNRRAKAQAGFPWSIEVLRPDQCAFVRDRVPHRGFAMFVVRRVIGLMDYNDALKKDGLFLSVNDQNRNVRVFRERERPVLDDPSGGLNEWGPMIEIAEVWTRDEYYEMARKEEGGEFVIVKDFKHPYERPPFALALGDTTNHPDPVHRYKPLLDGVFKTKASYDYERSLYRALAEQVALPRFWVKLSNGSFAMDDEGRSRLVLTQNAASAYALPEGAELIKIDMSVDQAFVQGLQLSAEELRASMPETGIVDVGASTAPHTLNMAQQQANIHVAQLKREQLKAVREMVRNMAMVMSKPADKGGFGEPVWVLAKVRDGEPIKDTVVGVDPADIPSLDVDVFIDPNSGTQKIAMIQFGRDRLADPNDPLTQRQYLEDFVGEENPDRRIDEWWTETTERMFTPQVLMQELQRRFGSQFVISPDGEIVGLGGQPVDPTAVLASNNISASLPPEASTAQGNVPGQAGLRPLNALQPLGANGGGIIS